MSCADHVSTPLQAAAHSGDSELVRKLVEDGEDVNTYCGHLQPALIEATMNGHHEVVQILLEAGANVNISSEGRSALDQAIKHGYQNIAGTLLLAGADVKGADSFARFPSPLHVAASSGFTRIVALLIEDGADVNYECGAMGTALTESSKSGHAIIVRLLLNSGAEVNAPDSRFGCALYGALSHNFPEVAEILLAAGAQPHPCLNRSACRGPLHVAASRGFSKVVDILIRRGADVNAHAGWTTPLIAASVRGHTHVVQRLLAAGANVNAWSSRLETALIAASRRGRIEVVEMLITAGADVNSFGGCYGSALAAARLNHRHEVVEALRAAGGKPNPKIFRLMDLPVEVRSMVYSLIMDRWSYTQRPQVEMRIIAPMRLSHNGAEAVVTSVPSKLRNVLQTSRQVRNEFLATFWNTAIFWLRAIFFGPKITRLGSCLLGNLRMVVIHGTIGGEMALRDLRSNLRTLKCLPRLQSVLLAVRKHAIISQSLGFTGEKEDIHSVCCKMHASLIEDCEILSFLRERFATLRDDEDVQEENMFWFRFWMRPFVPNKSTSTAAQKMRTPLDYAPLQLARCEQLSCRIAWSLATFFGPQYPSEKRSVWPSLPREQFHNKIIGEIDVSDLPRSVVVDDEEPKDTSLFRVLITPPRSPSEYHEETEDEESDDEETDEEENTQ